MRISIQFKPTKRLDLEFGYDTLLFSGRHWFTIIRVDLINGDIIYASLLFSLFKHYKYWFK